ncbi:glycosyltransferase [Arthrobacter sp. zg-Y750]|uniref:glycosyltransferase n=1 Tax=Arthrobacter sp. zg-Y750 TaxID=2894189 RepID=UPI001E5DA556|nr:glycosyltransferase [Arthrobacter sp. zg-Y750]MCC9177977.1 glycosyltransferase [Arthrobacter sp. zg-Y750]
MSKGTLDELGGQVPQNGQAPRNGPAPQDEHAPAGNGVPLRVLQRVVLPLDNELETLPLYIDRDTGPGAPAVAAGNSEQAGGGFRPDDILSRSSARVRPGLRVSFGSYFNGFPGGYWRRWTAVETVLLRVRTTGSGSVMVYRSTALGSAQRVAVRKVSGNGEAIFRLPLAAFGDGGWYWFDLLSGSGGMTLASADWCTENAAPARKATLGITTFNRPDYCLATMSAIAGDPGIRPILHELVVVDQGSRKVQDEAGYEAVAASLGQQLRVVNQDNLGGSGGFARIMSETVRSPESAYALLLDDDIVLEPEGVLRAVAFADLCRSPAIIGGHMFDMYNKSVLNAFAEMVNPYRFFWGPEKGLAAHDFAVSGLRSSSALHRRWDADYNGWWMCLIPSEVIRAAGLPLPVFIKWDDAEYSLRARDLGFPTVSLPGAAVWHVPWADKDDAVDWQAYFHERNRLIAALLHSPYPRGGRILRESLDTDFRHLFSMQYYPAALRLMALRDVLNGPAGLHESLPTMLPKLLALRHGYPDALINAKPGTLPFKRTGLKLPKPVRKMRGSYPPRWGPWTLKAVAKQTVQPSRTQPAREAAVSHDDSKWWVLSQLDGAVVTNAEGTGAARYRRDPRQVRRMLAETTALKLQLYREWARLRSAYRAALPDVTSLESWERTFTASTRGD